MPRLMLTLIFLMAVATVQVLAEPISTTSCSADSGNFTVKNKADGKTYSCKSRQTCKKTTCQLGGSAACSVETTTTHSDCAEAATAPRPGAGTHGPRPGVFDPGRPVGHASPAAPCSESSGQRHARPGRLRVQNPRLEKESRPMSSRTASRLKGLRQRAAIVAASSLMLWSSAALAIDNDSGPTQAQIDCQNRAVNDYWDNVRGCEQNLSDIPAQLQPCKNDARADLGRAKQQCLAAARAGASVSPGGGAVLDRGSGQTGSKPACLECGRKPRNGNRLRRRCAAAILRAPDQAATGRAGVSVRVEFAIVPEDAILIERQPTRTRQIGRYRRMLRD